MRFLLCSIAMVAAIIAAPSVSTADSGMLVGKWRGSYSCLQGHTGLQLTFGEGDEAAIAGEFAFFPLQDNPDVPTGRFAVSATYNERSRGVAVKGVRWIKQPTNYRMVDLTGTLSEDGKHIDGKVEFTGCTSFHVTREGGARQSTKAKGS